MKPLNPLLLTLLLAVLFSCGQTNQDKKKRTALKDTVQAKSLKEEQLERRKSIDAQEKADSLALAKVLNEALKIATENIVKAKFNKSYDVIIDSGHVVNVKMNSDYFFSKNQPHLMIRRSDRSGVFIDIYSKKGNQYERLLAHQEHINSYVSDTIRDINGDGLRDFVVNIYGSTGCCLKAFSYVYLIRQDQESFSKQIEFINPTFSPKEKLIRGVCYGHPGETELYKYQWKGEGVDTVEFVYYEKNSKDQKTGLVISSNVRPYDKGEKFRKRLKSVPKEYRKIEGYSWFTGKGYE